MACANTPQSQLTKTKNAFGLSKQLRRETPPTFYKHSPQKTSTSQSAKVHTLARLATRPRSASPLLACGRSEQSARSPQKPATAQPAPRTLADRKPTKTPLGLKPPLPQEAAPPSFTADKDPCPAKASQPSDSTAPPQAPQPQEQPLTPHRASAASQPLPDFQSALLRQLQRRQTCLRRFSQPLSLPQNHSSSPLSLSLFAFCALPPLPQPNDRVSGTACLSNNSAGESFLA